MVSCTWRWWMLTRRERNCRVENCHKFEVSQFPKLVSNHKAFWLLTILGEKRPTPVVLFCPVSFPKLPYNCNGLPRRPAASYFYCLWNLVLQDAFFGSRRPPMAFMTPFLQWRNWHRPPCARRLERWPWIGRLPWLRAKTSLQVFLNGHMV